MDTLRYIIDKYKLDVLKSRLPVEIPGTNRVTLAELFSELGFTKGAEIGVDCALYSEVLCKKNPHAKIYCVDPWLAYEGYLPYIDQAQQEEDFDACKRRLAPYNNYEIVRKTSMDALSDFDNNSLDFVYIDANHVFEYVVNDISGWSKKVRPGGIVSGHDYNRTMPSSDLKNNPVHVMPAVHGYTDAYNIKPWFVLGKKDATWRDGRDKYRSWFWVKQ